MRLPGSRGRRSALAGAEPAAPAPRIGSATLVVAGIIGGLVLTGCDEGPKGRPLNYEPGVYKGEPDQPLGEEAMQALRDRARHQRADFATGTGSSMPPLAREDTRMPLSPDDAGTTGDGALSRAAGGDADGSAEADGAGPPRVGADEDALRERMRRQTMD